MDSSTAAVYRGIVLSPNEDPEVERETGFASHYIEGPDGRIDLRLDLENKSEVFSWGADGTAAQQAAIAVLSEVVSDQYAMNNYDSFVSNFLQHVDPVYEWVLNARQVVELTDGTIDSEERRKLMGTLGETEDTPSGVRGV